MVLKGEWIIAARIKVANFKKKHRVHINGGLNVMLSSLELKGRTVPGMADQILNILL